MNRMTFIRILFVACTGLLFSLSGLHAQDAAERIRQRLPDIDTLKAAGVIGETSDGMVAARAILNEDQEAIIESENRDRRELYAIVARRSGVSVEEVGKQRALTIARQAKAGVWLQDARGSWYRKGQER